MSHCFIPRVCAIRSFLVSLVVAGVLACGNGSESKAADFKIQATVTGLTDGNRLVLQVTDGGFSSTVNQNGTVDLLYGSTGAKYHVTVKTPPSTPPETCTISHGEGWIASGNVTDILVTCSEKTFSLQVTVAGLAGGGLSLCENYTDGTCASAIPITKNGDALIRSSLADGVSYLLVFAGGQPTSPWQTCSFKNGSSDGTKAGGTIRGADVTVAVTCTTNKYSIGGTISGLKGNGLKLSLVGQEDLTLAPDASSFAFPGQIDSGSPYTISIAAGAQPTNPWQTCTVASATGIVQKQDVSALVNCVTNSYPVVVNLSGYAGSGLVLSSGNQTIGPISSSSLKVQFPAPVLSGADYAVIVKSQPTGPHQLCTAGYDAATAASNGGIPNALVTCQTIHAITGRIVGLASAATGTGTVSLRGTQTAIGSAQVDASGNYRIDVLDGSYSDITLSLQGVTAMSLDDTTTVVVNGADAAGPDLEAVESTCLGRWCPIDWSPPNDKVSYGAFRAVSGSSSRDVWTVRSPGAIYHWNGSSWTSAEYGDTYSNRFIAGLWVDPSGDVWAYGTTPIVGGMPSIQQIDQSWEIHEHAGLPANASWRGAWGMSSTDIWFVGGSSVVHWDGNTYVEMDSCATDLVGVWAAGPSELWAIGSGNAVCHRIGGSWVTLSSGTDSKLNSVWGSSSGDVWAVGVAGTIVHWDSDRWSPSPYSGVASSRDLYGIWGSGAEDVWAVGAGGTILHWDGSSWSAVSSGTSGDLFAVWGSGPGNVWAVGDTILRWRNL